MTWQQYDGQQVTLRQGKTGVLIAVPVMSELQVVLDEALQKRRKQLIEKLEESGARLNEGSSGGIAATMRDGRAASKATKSDRFSPL